MTGSCRELSTWRIQVSHAAADPVLHSGHTVYTSLALYVYGTRSPTSQLLHKNKQGSPGCVAVLMVLHSMYRFETVVCCVKPREGAAAGSGSGGTAGESHKVSDDIIMILFIVVYHKIHFRTSSVHVLK